MGIKWKRLLWRLKCALLNAIWRPLQDGGLVFFDNPLDVGIKLKRLLRRLGRTVLQRKWRSHQDGGTVISPRPS